MQRQLIVSAVSAFIGAVLAVFSLDQLKAPAGPTLQTEGAAPDLSVVVSRDLFIREANRRIGPILDQYDLRDPSWELGDDDIITLITTGQLPIVGTDVGITIRMQPVVQEGALAIDILSIDYGLLRIGAGPLDGLAADVNEQLKAALNREKFEVQSVRTTVDSVLLEVKVVGEL